MSGVQATPNSDILGGKGVLAIKQVNAATPSAAQLASSRASLSGVSGLVVCV
jgi:hypothetical protein